MRSELALALALSLAPAAARAQTGTPARDLGLWMRGGYGVDVAYAASGLGLMALGAFALRAPTVDVAPFDGLGHRDASAAASTASDVVLIAGGVGLPVFAWASERAFAGTRGARSLRAPVVLVESALMALGVVGVVKSVVGECRPRAWSDAAQRCVGDVSGASSEDRLAFPSGHTAPLAAMAGASLGMVLLPRGPRGAFVPLLGLTTALAGANLVLRVVAGAHSWVDTTVGFSLGFGVGFVTALLHAGVTTPPRVSFGASPGGLSVRGVF